MAHFNKIRIVQKDRLDLYITDAVVVTILSHFYGGNASLAYKKNVYMQRLACEEENEEEVCVDVKIKRILRTPKHSRRGAL